LRVPSIASVAALLSFVATTATAAPIVQWPVNGHFYTTTDVAMTWTAADTFATGSGGYLVSVLSAEENEFLRSTFFDGLREAFWIGFTDQAVEGSFVWTSSEATVYTNWAPGEPNNDGNEDYTVTNWHYAEGLAGAVQGSWNDTFNVGSFDFATNAVLPNRAILEFNVDPTAVPEPATILLIGTALASVAMRRYRRHRRSKSPSPLSEVPHPQQRVIS
jgi:hypothetical protein